MTQTIDENETILTSFIKLQSKASTSNPIPFDAIISNLPTSIKEVTVSPDSKKIFYMTSDSGAKGFVANPDGTNPSQIFSNFLSEWIPHWGSAGSILIGSKASYTSRSIGLMLGVSSKKYTPDYTGYIGASSLLRPDGKYILLGSGPYPSLTLKTVSTDASTAIDINTLPEKCAWDPSDNKFIICGVPKTISGSFPDDWYKGLVQTNDIIQKINVFDLYTYILIDPKVEDTSVDTLNLQISKDGKTIIFTNKVDQSLWLLKNN